MAFSHQLNSLSKEELAAAAREEFGETPKLMEVRLSIDPGY